MTVSNPLRKGKPLFRWGPLDGSYMTIAGTALGVLVEFYKRTKIIWPSGALIAKGNRWQWLQDLEQLHEYSVRCFREAFLDDAKMNEYRELYDTHVSQWREYNMKVFRSGLKQYSDDALLQEHQKWWQGYLDFFAYCTAAELSTFGAVDYLQRQLEQLGIAKKEVLEVVAVLSSPTDLSFYQKAEVDLIQRWLSIDSSDTDAVEQLLTNYATEYYWLLQSYGGGPVYTSANAHEHIQELLQQGDLQEQLDHHLEYTDRLSLQQQEVKKQYNISDELMHWGARLGYAVSWQDERKGEQFSHIYTMMEFVKEYCRRFQLQKEDALQLIPIELYKYYSDPQRVKQLADERREYCAVLFNYKEVTTLTGKSGKEFVQEWWEDPSVDQGVLSGAVVSAAGQDKIEGTVRVVHSAYDETPFEQGEILIAPMTSPEFISIMRKAKAIVTDEGGLTCHAAVVSRELKTPCIVGAKHATKLLQDGDHVTMDLTTGIITINK